MIKVNTNPTSEPAPKLMNFSTIGTGDFGVGVCYVNGGTHKVNPNSGIPHITLYLQDTNGIVLQGYVFNVSDFIKSGQELTTITHKLVRITWAENYFTPVGLTLKLNKVELINNYTPADLAKFIGEVDNLPTKAQELQQFFIDELSIKAALPYNLISLSSIKYEHGKIGGVLNHYTKISQELTRFKDLMTPEEYSTLIKTFLLFISVSSTYLLHEADGTIDAKLMSVLSRGTIEKAQYIKAHEGILELVPSFFGCETKDLYVNLVKLASENLLTTENLINLHHSLPLTREGSTDGITIRRYPNELSE